MFGRLRIRNSHNCWWANQPHFNCVDKSATERTHFNCHEVRLGIFTYTARHRDREQNPHFFLVPAHFRLKPKFFTALERGLQMQILYPDRQPPGFERTGQFCCIGHGTSILQIKAQKTLRRTRISQTLLYSVYFICQLFYNNKKNDGINRRPEKVETFFTAVKYLLFCRLLKFQRF